MMKTLLKKRLLLVFAILMAYMTACKQGTKASENSGGTDASKEEQTTKKDGQSIIEDDVSKNKIMKIANGSKDHTTLITAVKEAYLENDLVN